MSGRYTGYSKTAGIVLMAVCILFVPLFILMTNIPVFPALIVIGLMLALIIALAVLTECLPCRFSADENGFTMKRLFVTRRYGYGDIADMKCSVYSTTRSGRAVMALSLTTADGESEEFLEVSRCRTADMVNDAETCKPQLKRLCEYILSVSERAPE